jgi:site-specific DNA-methyltransferase (adenine-specific)
MNRISEVFNDDCVFGISHYTDDFFDLAIVDPPYGIGKIEGKEAKDGCTHGKDWKRYEKKGWDKSRPTPEYWAELRRVSKNQIVWGANYFTDFLPASMGWIFWDKGQDLTMSDGELAYTSFDRALRRVIINRNKIGEYGGFIHPTQKPVKLYKWLLKKYASKGDRILDTHMGSQSSRIACFLEGFDYWGWEIDKEYFDKGNQRFKEQTAQIQLF